MLTVVCNTKLLHRYLHAVHQGSVLIGIPSVPIPVLLYLTRAAPHVSALYTECQYPLSVYAIIPVAAHST